MRVPWPRGNLVQLRHPDEDSISALVKVMTDPGCQWKIGYCHKMGQEECFLEPRGYHALSCAIILINGKLWRPDKDKSSRTGISQEGRVGSFPRGHRSHPAQVLLEAKGNTDWVVRNGPSDAHLGLGFSSGSWAVAAQLPVSRLASPRPTT